MNKRFLSLILSISIIASIFSCIPVLAEESPNFTAGTIAKVAGLMDSGRTLAVHMYALSSEGLYMNQMYATGVILMLIVLLINGCSGMIAKKIAKK